jgi:hypothetical protein
MSDRVGAHGFLSYYFSRRMCVDLTRTGMPFRGDTYVRQGCKEGHFLQKRAAAVFAEFVGMDLDVVPQSECAQDVIQYNTRSWLGIQKLWLYYHAVLHW